MDKTIGMTDEAVELEIEQLKHSEFVQLAKEEERARYRRRQYLYQLRWLEKRGRQLAAQGVDLESLIAAEEEG